MRRLPMLDDVRIASPCTASWNEMVGDDRVRFCSSCEKSVFNLSAMLAHEAEELLAERMNGELCVRFYQRADGTMMTQDCPVGVKKKRRKKLALAVAGAGAMAAAAATAFLRPERTMLGQTTVAQPPCHIADIGGGPTTNVDDPGGRHLMGDVAPALMGSVMSPPPPPPADDQPQGGATVGRIKMAPPVKDGKKKI